MAFPDVSIQIGSGLGRREPSEDNISAMVMNGVATTATSTTAALALGAIVELNSVLDAEGYGLDAAYDNTNKVLVYHHITRFFFRNPNGKLFIMLVAQTVTLTLMADKAQPYLKTLLSSSLVAGRVRQAAIALNPLTTYTPTLTGGLDNDVLTALPKAQALADEQLGLFRPVFIIIEGRQFNGTATAATNLRALAYPNCSVVIAQDKPIADITISAGNPYKYYAAVGDALGYRSFASVHQNTGWVDRFPLTNVAEGIFTLASLSNNVDVASHEADYATLHDKGYTFAISRAGRTGYFFQSDPTCVAVSNDLAYAENVCTVNKAVRLVRAALVGAINGPVPLTAAGKMEPAFVGGLEAIGKQALVENMLNEGEISACRVYIDNNQVFVTNGEQIPVEFDMVITGTARTIKAKLTLRASL